MSKRVIILEIVFSLLFIAIVGRLAVLQIFQGKEYEAQAATQESFAHDPSSERGRIYFQSGGALFLAATQKRFYSFILNAQQVKNPEDVYAFIRQYSDFDRESFDEAMRKKDPFEVIAKRIDEDTKKRMQENAPPGINFVPQLLRYYPGGTLAAHVLGFVGNDERGVSGRYGIEQAYEKQLSFSGPVSVEKSSESIFSFLRDPIFYNTGGSDIVLTIDVSVQTMAEEILDEVMEKWQTSKGGIIVVNPQNGKVLAMAGRPTFNPNKYFTESISTFVNPMVQDVFEMGSVFKPITIASGIDNGSVVPSTTYTDYGSVSIDGYTISNYDGKGRGLIDIQRVLAESLNTGAVFVAEQMGNNIFLNYLKQFGLGERTGIDLSGEVPSNISNLNSSRFIEFATASFGQGISVTPIGFTMALSAVANGGELVEPHVVGRIQISPSHVEEIPIKVKRRVISEDSSRAITRMLVNIVDHNLWDGDAVIPGYSMAAKTGTAQIPSKEKRGYSDQFLHSFFAYAPAYDPQFLIFMFIEKPVGVRYASQSLTGGARKMMQFLLSYYNIPPDRL